jgi:hypothetical protein
MVNFDSVIRRFDPSRPSQPLARPKIAVILCAKACICGVFAYIDLVSRLRKPTTMARSSRKSRAQTAKTPVCERLLVETNFDPIEW